MSDIDHLLAVVDAYRAATGFAEATISKRFLGRGGRLADLRGGGDMGARTISRTIARFSEDWPVDAVWPAQAPRPVPPPQSGEAA